MRNTKVYSILEHFDKYEQNRLRKYLSSPYFNKNETLVELFEQFVNHINSEIQGDWAKEKVWKKIMPGVPYDDVRFRKYLSELLKLVEGFLAQNVYEKNPLHQATYLMDAVGKKKMTALYNSTMKTARRLSIQQKHRPASYYYYQYQIEKNFYELTGFDIKRTQKTNEEEIIQNLDYFYLAEKLRLLCSVMSRQYIVSTEYELLFIEEIINYIKKYKFEDVPAISIYYQIYLTQIESEHEEHYFKLKNLLGKNSHLFPKNQANDMYYYAMNYCIRRANKGNQNFLSELFILYQELIEKRLIFNDEGKLSPWTFKNIVVAALRLGEYKWAEDFVNQFSENIPEQFRDNAVTYNLAQVYFYQKRFNEVASLLQTVEYEDFTYNLGSKAMLLATYYETDELEPLHSLFGSFRTFLNRQKSFPKDRRDSYLNLIKFTKKLTNVTSDGGKSIKKIRQEVEVTKNIASIGWLREKIAELED
ncbi:MAG: hypothetical protein DHS20C18_12740 [Saprospiraceae bacterium]|nr:MAG: hypothetical protein DHS20C18_12740 [Saprospiraceae bacterium]